MEQRDLTYYIFNNRADFQQYNDILGANSDGSEGVIVNNRNIVTFRSRAMDNILAHEITHLLQAKFAPQAIRSFASQTPEVIPFFIGEKVEKLNNEKMQAAKSSSEAENGRRSRRSIDQSHIEPPFSTNSDNQALAPNTTRALPSLNLESKIKNNQATSGASKPSSWVNVFANTIVDAVKGISQFISSPFKPAIDMKHSQPSKAITAQGIDTNGTLLLLDVFIRKVTGQKYISNNIRSISEQEAQIHALPIAKEFEQALEDAAIESGIPVTNLKFNPVEVFLKVAGQIRSGKFSEISKTLYSSAKEACPEFEQTGEFLVHVKSHLEEFLAKKETVFLQQKQTADQPTSSVSRKVVAMEPSKKPDTFLSDTSVVKGIKHVLGL